MLQNSSGRTRCSVQIILGYNGRVLAIGFYVAFGILQLKSTNHPAENVTIEDNSVNAN